MDTNSVTQNTDIIHIENAINIFVRSTVPMQKKLKILTISIN